MDMYNMFNRILFVMPIVLADFKWTSINNATCINENTNIVYKTFNFEVGSYNAINCGKY